jgi:hypothetical protein
MLPLTFANVDHKAGWGVDLLPGVLSGAGLYIRGARGVLVQPEMESWRSPLASITPIRRAGWGLRARAISLGGVAGAGRGAALFPELFPIPELGRYLGRQRESELMCEHAHLTAMVGFVRDHVAEHLRADRPGLGPAVSVKLLDAAPTIAERFSEHLLAASGALGQRCAGLLRCAVCTVELWWNLHVRSGEPDPFGADIVHMGEDRGDGADVAGRFSWRFRHPDGGVKMFDENLVDAIVGGKDPDCGSAELSVNFGLTRGHGSLCSLTYITSGSPVIRE